METEVDKIILKEKFAQFSEHWSPKILTDLNGQQVKAAKLLGEFDWHHHENEDELFWVMHGTLEMHFRDRVVEVQPGEIIVVPKGVEHKPVAHEEVHIILFEPASTLNTGEAVTDRTVKNLDRI